MKIHIITYGCTANQSDSQIMESVLEKSGHKTTSSLKDADCVIINTCAVKEATENKIISKLSKLSGTGKKIVIGGCLPKVNMDRIKEAVPNFSGILDTRSLDKLPEIISSKSDGLVVFSEEAPIKPAMAKRAGNSITGIVQLSEGCDLSCTYCATTIARGGLSCFPPDDIVRGASRLVKAGCREILLTSQDNGAYNYGKDRLPDILEKICSIDSDFYVRNGMTNPMYLNLFLDRLIQVYKNPKAYKFLHLPVQSGSDNVLKLMKRGYTAGSFTKIVKAFRQEIPEITIATDLIVGFPGETEKDFGLTKRLVEDVGFDVVNISKYGNRPGTEATKMKQVDREDVNRRSAELAQLCKSASFERNKKWVGWSGPCLVNETGKNDSFVCRNYAYKPIVLRPKTVILGQFMQVKVVKPEQTYVVGEPA